MELRFIERTEREPVNGNIYREKTVRILQYREYMTHGLSGWSAWQDVPLVSDTGTDSPLANNV